MFGKKKKQPDYLANKKILLIHGFGTSVRDELIRIVSKQKVRPSVEYEEFKAFNHLIKEKNAFIFRWNDDFKALKIKDFTAIEKYIDLYKREKIKSLAESTQKTLDEFIKKNNPEIIVCHSMGCFLLLNYLEKYELSNSVKKIFLVQGDFDKKHKIINPEIIKRIEENKLRIVNVYCPWDTTLMLSPLVNKLIVPAGLNRMRNPYIVDVLFPLTNNMNLHNSSIKSKDLLDFVLKY